MPETLAAADSSAVPVSPAATPTPRPRRWAWWLLAIVGLVVGLVLVAQHFLDPWLKQKLEQQVAAQTNGQYRLQVGELRTNLWQRAVRLRHLRLRPAAQVADTLPRVRLDAARLHITGVGLLALLRKGVVPIDSLVLDSLRIEVLALARKPTKNANKPLHERLPLRVAGVAVGYFGLLHTQANYRPNGQPTAQFRQANLSARDLEISATSAADSQRVGYAAAWELQLRQTQALVAGHSLALRGLQLSTANKSLTIDSLRIAPSGSRQAQNPSVSLALPRLRLTGFETAPLQHHRRFRADSVLFDSPQLAVTPPAAPAAKQAPTAARWLRQLDLGHFAVRNGQLRVTGIAEAPIIRGIELTAASLRYDSVAASDVRRVLFAKSWNVALGKSQATVAAHPVTLESLRFSTAAGTFSLRSLRVRPPAAGQGQPGGVRLDLVLPSLALTGLDAMALQHQGRFQAAALLVNEPKLTFTPPKQAPPPVWKMLAPMLRRSDLGQLRVRGADLRIGGLRHSPEVFGLNLTGNSIRIDSLSALAPARIAYARSWQGRSGRVTAPFDPPYYRASSQQMYLDTDAKTFRFDNMALTPKYSAVNMNLRKGYQAPAITIRVAALAFEGLDFAELVRHTNFRVAKVTALRPLVRIASDGRGPINPNWSKVSPEEMRKLPMIVDVRRLDIQGGNLYSTYRSPLTPITGTMSINRFNGSFYNLSNDRQRQTVATPLTGHATTYLQNLCRLDAQVSMYLLDPKGRHRVWGAFGPGPFAMLNSMTVPTRLVKFKSGDVRRMRFDLRADRQGVTGTTWTEYANLQMTLLSYQDEAEEVKKSLFSRVKSKVVNVVVIRDQNPRKRGELVTGEMTSTREPRFSVFTLWRQGIVSGLFHNVGVPQKIAQKLSESKDEAPLPK
ncbi:hypothetical protein I2I05_07580 [Hymenobacter sp. BT683]|uniref:DUF748 domain-containing protein n=1 Tax=Hymenobacter jeongseonensis TaxID=2791027 RepID=A0ABS0IFW1_9BACT|nr:hypothetical protein [Hymenobacter jeongseonensis]MBF9237254.1 hypothetical protein [Hymenobacter jeongseonensis]